MSNAPLIHHDHSDGSSSSDDSSADVPLAALAGRNSENDHGDGSSSDDSSVDVVGAIPPTILRLESNDPSLTQLSIGNLRIPGNFTPAAGEWGRTGTAVAGNAHLRELTLDLTELGGSVLDTTKLLRGVPINASLKKVHLNGCNLVINFSRLVRMRNNVELLEMNQCAVRPHGMCVSGTLGLFLRGMKLYSDGASGFNSLRVIKVNDTLQSIGGGDGLRDRGAPEKLLKTVVGRPGLKRLILCTETLVGGWHSSLAFLLGQENDCVVLDLYNNCTGEIDWDKFGESLKNPPDQLQSLVQTKGWQDIATILQGPHFRPAQLSFREDGTRENSDNLIVGLKSLNLGRHSRSVYFPQGWGQLYDLLQKPSCVLEDLDLSMGTQFSDEESSSLFDALKNNSSLKNLNLSGCLRKATSRTWNSISAMLEGDKTVLEKLNLCYSPVNNDAFYAFSCNLAVNDKMRELLLYNDPDWMTRWQPYARVLCNKTSIGHTFDSNHTLQRVVNNKRQPKGIKDLLERNQEENKFDVARQKVIDVHFPDGFVGMDPFVDMELALLPRALAWVARGGTRGQVDGRFWEFLKSQPTLFAGGNSKQSAKRKRED